MIAKQKNISISNFLLEPTIIINSSRYDFKILRILNTIECYHCLYLNRAWDFELTANKMLPLLFKYNTSLYSTFNGFFFMNRLVIEVITRNFSHK